MFEPNCLIAVISPEISLKSKKVQERMRTILKKNMMSSLKNNSIPYNSIAYRSGRLFIYTNELEKAFSVLKNCFGILSLIRAQKEKISSLKDVENIAVKISEKEMRKEFAVRAKSFKKEIKSKQVEIEVGSALLDSIPNLKVNLSHPETQLNIVLFEEKAFFYFEEKRVIGGMPVGTQGKVALISEKKEIIYNLLKTGCRIVLVDSNSFKEMEKYNSYNEFEILSLEEAIEQYKEKRVLAFFTDFKDENTIKELNKKLPVKVFAPYLLA